MGFGASFKAIVGKVAPTIGAALGGPVGGIATKFLADKLLGKPEATQQEVEEFVMGANPEQMLELKKLNLQFESDMKKLDIDVFKLEVDDRKSARDLFKISIWPQIALSVIFIVGYFIIVRSISAGHTVIQDQFLQGVYVTVIGVMTAAIPQILNFWFGSSMGSKEKTRDLAVSTPAVGLTNDAAKK